MDSWLVMAYSYASTHPVVLEANGRVTHTHKTHTARIDQMTVSLAVSSPRRHRHNPPSTAGTPRHLEGPVFVGENQLSCRLECALLWLLYLLLHFGVRLVVPCDLEVGRGASV